MSVEHCSSIASKYEYIYDADVCSLHQHLLIAHVWMVNMRSRLLHCPVISILWTKRLSWFILFHMWCDSRTFLATAQTAISFSQQGVLFTFECSLVSFFVVIVPSNDQAERWRCLSTEISFSKLHFSIAFFLLTKHAIVATEHWNSVLITCWLATKKSCTVEFLFSLITLIPDNYLSCRNPERCIHICPFDSAHNKTARWQRNLSSKIKHNKQFYYR